MLPWIWFRLCTSQLDWANNVFSLSQSFEIQDGSQQNNPRTLDDCCFRLCDVTLCVSSNQRQRPKFGRSTQTSERFCVRPSSPLLPLPLPLPLPLGRPDTQVILKLHPVSLTRNEIGWVLTYNMFWDSLCNLPTGRFAVQERPYLGTNSKNLETNPHNNDHSLLRMQI